MTADDRVCYTEDHQAWLRMAGRWVQGTRRQAFQGHVESASGGIVCVMWDRGRPWPAKESRTTLQPSYHLAENLEEAPRP